MNVHGKRPSDRLGPDHMDHILGTYTAGVNQNLSSAVFDFSHIILPLENQMIFEQQTSLDPRLPYPACRGALHGWIHISVSNMSYR